MQNIFTLEELKQIRESYIKSLWSTYICHASILFEDRWRNISSKLLIIDLVRDFLQDSKLEHCYNSPTTGSLFLIYPKEIIIDSNKDGRKIRIDFLDWLIENTES